MADDQTTDTGASGATDDKQQQDQQQTTSSTADDTGKGGKDQVLADLARERDKRQAAERAAKDATAELEKLRKEHMSEAEKAVAKAKEEGKAEALTTANVRLLKAEVRAAAAGKLADPGMAVKLLDLDEFTVDDEGDVDAKAIGKAVDQLVKQYPALAANGGPGNGDGGARRTATGASMNDLIRERMHR